MLTLANPESGKHIPADLQTLLAKYQLLPQLQRELTIDHAIAEWERATNTPIIIPPEEITTAYQNWQQTHSSNTPDPNSAQTEQPQRDVEEWCSRRLKIEQFKRLRWQHQLESYFLKRKGQLDRVIYSLIRVRQQSIAQELYFRLRDDEQSFAELAPAFSQGLEAQTSGLVGPVELGSLHPFFAKQLRSSRPNELLLPMRLEDWFVVVRLESFLRAQLDDAMKQRLLNELFENWLAEQ
uniref:peptidylprolyl isomerase n=1 Tax=Oscillatoriales cyanobacterium SpSt-402 TaxID=2282168 RepID=A0A832M2G2_9CYAN